MILKTIVALVVVTIALFGCATDIPMDRLPNETKTTFTYNYEIESVNQSNLWKRARDYFAGAYGDSRSVFRVMDENEGTIIGKGSSSWLVGNSMHAITCFTDYHIRFIAKDNKARLQLEIINEVQAASPCKGWPLPSKQGFELIAKSFDDSSKALEKALNGGGSSNEFKKI